MDDNDDGRQLAPMSPLSKSNMADSTSRNTRCRRMPPPKSGIVIDAELIISRDEDFERCPPISGDYVEISAEAAEWAADNTSVKEMKKRPRR